MADHDPNTDPAHNLTPPTERPSEDAPAVPDPLLVDRIYTPEPGELQLTLRAVLTGCCLGGIVSAMNIYFGLRTGWSIGGSLIAAILGFAVWTAIQRIVSARRYTPLETNITQTSGSAAGSMASAAGLLAAIPALYIMHGQSVENLAIDIGSAQARTAYAAAHPDLSASEIDAMEIGAIGPWFADLHPELLEPDEDTTSETESDETEAEAAGPTPEEQEAADAALARTVMLAAGSKQLLIEYAGAHPEFTIPAEPTMKQLRPAAVWYADRDDAIALQGTVLGYGQMTLWALSVAYLGVFFAVPLRNQMVVVEKLRFPTGTATAETIVSMFAEGAQALAQARTLVLMAIFAGVFTLGAFFVPQLGHPNPEDWELGAISLTLGVGAAWGFSLLISPLMFGAGIIIGTRVAVSLLLGAIVSWAILGPLAQAQGWTGEPIMSYQTGPRGWILWPGVAIMVADALTNLALSWRTILRTFSSKGAADAGMESKDERIPNSWWIIGLALGSTATVVVAWKVFDIPPWMTIVAVAMSSVLAMIAVRSTGETDINPIGGMGKITQLVFGGMGQSQAAGQTMTAELGSQLMTTNLMAAAITGAGASQAGDMMQDLKTGRMLGASPRKQIIAQCVGITAGVAVAVPIFLLFIAAGEVDPRKAIGGPEVTAPAAQAWKAMAEVLSKGFDELPTHANWSILAGLLFGMLMPILRKSNKALAPYLPSGLAFGIAFIVPAYYSIAMFFGAMGLLVWQKINPKAAAAFAIAVASGLIAGEGLMGVVTSVLTLMGFGPIT